MLRHMLEPSVNEAALYRGGYRLIIEPAERALLFDLLATWAPLAIDFPELTDEKPDAVEL